MCWLGFTGGVSLYVLLYGRVPARTSAAEDLSFAYTWPILTQSVGVRYLCERFNGSHRLLHVLDQLQSA